MVEQFSQKNARTVVRFARHQRQGRERFAETARIAFSYSASDSVFSLCRFLPYGQSAKSLPISEPFADDTLNGASGTLYIIYAQPNTIATAEIKFRKIPVQVFLLAMLVDAFHAPFEDRIVTLDGIGVDVAANVLVIAVLHGSVASKGAADVLVVAGLVGHQRSFAINVGADNRVNLPGAGIFNMKATRAAFALDQSEDSVFVSPSGPALALAVDTADESFVGLDDLARTAHRSHTDNAHCFTDAVRHEPSGLESDAQSPRKLIARNALFARAEQIHRLEPQVHRDVAILEHRADLHGELFAALVALVEANAGRFTVHLADTLNATAMRANRAVRPYAGLNPCDSGSLVLEDFGGQDRIGHDTVFPLMNQYCHREMGLSSTISPSRQMSSVWGPFRGATAKAGPQAR